MSLTESWPNEPSATGFKRVIHLVDEFYPFVFMSDHFRGSVDGRGGPTDHYLNKGVREKLQITAASLNVEEKHLLGRVYVGHLAHEPGLRGSPLVLYSVSSSVKAMTAREAVAYLSAIACAAGTSTGIKASIAPSPSGTASCIALPLKCWSGGCLQPLAHSPMRSVLGGRRGKTRHHKTNGFT